MPQLTVEEASETYIAAMRNVLPAGPGVCSVCSTFIDPGYARCIPCSGAGDELASVVAITYSEHLGQIHTVLRGYKDGPETQRRYMMIRLTAILWRFLEAHEACVATSAAVTEFDLVVTVPSSTVTTNQARGNLRQIVEWCSPIADRFDPILQPTDAVASGREISSRRYATTDRIDGKAVLLIDDTWVGGGHARSAAATLRAAGASTVAALVIGRHMNPGWIAGDRSCRELLDALPRTFSWDVCSVHRPSTSRR
ncbi:MAG: hypothetical protein ACRDLP_09505 [Solirubrobacteraceae bacterium]